MTTQKIAKPAALRRTGRLLLSACAAINARARALWSHIKPSALRIIGILAHLFFLGAAAAGVLMGIVYIDKTYFQYITHDGLSSAEFFAGIVSLVGITLLAWRSHLLYQQVNMQIAKEIDDQFNAAINHLASAETSARTGGIYSLYHLGIQQEKYRTESFQILCSHIRSKTQEPEYQKNHPDRPSNEIQTTINLLFKRQNGQDGLYFTHHATLPGADLSHAHLAGADFAQANCQNANFMYANCQKTLFWYANCRKAHFTHANCQEASFYGAHCQKTHFLEAECQEAFFSDAKCQKARFLYAKCQGADFTLANCQRACFQCANCQKVYFVDTNIDGADFAGAIIAGAKFDDGKTPSTERPE